MRVALAHDYLTQLGGAERVALALTRIFPGSPLYTALYDPERTFPEFGSVDVRTSRLQRVAPFRRDPRRALPLLAGAWRDFGVEADSVLISSSGWAHALRVPSGVRKIVYCHNPARWLYQGDEYLTGAPERAAIRVLGDRLRAWDQRMASTVHTYLANSSVVASRIELAYGVSPVVVHPPVSVDVAGPAEPIPGIEPGFWLTIARGRGYKNTETVVHGVTRLLGDRLVVAGGRPPPERDLPNRRLHRTGRVTDAQLRWLYRNARGLVTVAYEDFGLTPIEANAFGTPAIALRAGGFLDSVVPGVSGAWIERPTPGAVATALAHAPAFDRAAVIANADRFSFGNFAERIRAVMGLSAADVRTAA